MGKRELIDKSVLKTCNACAGKGCKLCDNGIYKDESYIIVGQTKGGQKIAFQSDYKGK